MLYASTRSKTDSYTAHRALQADRAPDGGYFLPFRLPVLKSEQIAKLKNQTFSETVSLILNLYFSTGITAWDVDCCIGKSAAKIISMPHRVLVAQLWDNPAGEYGYICQSLYECLIKNKVDYKASNWAFIAIRIAVLFGIFSLLQKQNIDSFDLSVNVGDFSDPMAAWYAKQMGLPIGTIVCACNDNSATWDFLHRGELNTGVTLVNSQTPDLDVVNPEGLERFIFCTLGYEETQKYLMSSEKKKMYQIRPDMIDTMSRDMFVSVVGKDRVEAVISSVYRSNQCVLDPYAAVSYGSLQDYRAKTGESCPTVLLWDRSPLKNLSVVQRALGLGEAEIKAHLNQL